VPGASGFQTTWQGTHTARRNCASDAHACSYRLADQPLPPGATPLCCSLKLQLSPSGSKPIARRCTSNAWLLVWHTFN